MIQCDLSQAKAVMESHVTHPTEAELFAIAVGLMILQDCSYWDLKNSALVLNEHNFRRVAELIAARMPPFVRIFGDVSGMCLRLRGLVGLRLGGVM